MKIDNEFTVSVPIQRAWEVLTDLEGVALCLPGAQMTGVDGDVYSGKVKIKVGPVISDYAGTAQFAEKDDKAYHALINAKGKDSRGAGTASAAISAQLRENGSRTVVTVSTDLNITGKIAQFGSGMIKEVSAKLLGQFVENLEGRLLAPAAPTGGPAVDPAPPSVAPPAGPSSAAPVAPTALPSPGGAHAAEPATGAGVVSDADQVPPPTIRHIVAQAEPEPLDLLSVAGGSVYKRLIPVAAAAVLAVVLVIVLRRRGSHD